MSDRTVADPKPSARSRAAIAVSKSVPTLSALTVVLSTSTVRIFSDGREEGLAVLMASNKQIADGRALDPQREKDRAAR
jgi:hypothetical protein